jgi:leader peptidase (prepilin peptidase)/N-methyltransferase
MILLDLPLPFVLTFLFVIGSCIGSFLNVCVYRFPIRRRLLDQLKSLNSHGSGCPRCAASIRWYDNIPIFGWLRLGGRCRACRLPISPRYPLVEMLTGVLFVVLYLAEIPQYNANGTLIWGVFSDDGPQNVRLFPMETWLHVRYALHAALICALIVASMIDLELWIIPDGSTVPLMVTSVVLSGCFGQNWLVPLWFQDASIVQTLRTLLPAGIAPLLFYWDCMPFAAAWPHLHGLLVSLAGLVVGGGVVWLVRIIGAMVFRREAMGFGDVVLMAMIGSVIGWQPSLIVFLFLAPLMASVVAFGCLLTGRGTEIPYGPWLSLATLLLLLAWPWIWPAAEQFFDQGPVLLLLGVIMFLLLIVVLQLIQTVKRMLGIKGPAEQPQFVDDGIPMLYPAERSDPCAGLWPRSLWTGVRSGQGLQQQHSWKHGGGR